jgi:hypothetical protein
MKKWMIIAVVAAMFAMIMFPACGGDDGEGDDRAASEVTATLVGNELLITWTGSPGVDYTVYYAKKENTPSREAKEAAVGQRTFKYTLDDDTGTVVQRVNDNPDYWSVYSDGDTDDDATTSLSGLVTNVLSGNGQFCFGVGPAYTGSFAIDENVPIVWDIQNDPDNGKDYGYLGF